MSVVKQVVYRSARTGRFVARKFAERFRATTTRETLSRRDPDICLHCGQRFSSPSPHCLFRERHRQ